MCLDFRRPPPSPPLLLLLPLLVRFFFCWEQGILTLQVNAKRTNVPGFMRGRGRGQRRPFRGGFRGARRPTFRPYARYVEKNQDASCGHPGLTGLSTPCNRCSTHNGQEPHVFRAQLETRSLSSIFRVCVKRRDSMSRCVCAALLPPFCSFSESTLSFPGILSLVAFHVERQSVAVGPSGFLFDRPFQALLAV
jgi:hypothetical protein